MSKMTSKELARKEWSKVLSPQRIYWLDSDGHRQLIARAQNPYDCPAGMALDEHYTNVSELVMSVPTLRVLSRQFVILIEHKYWREAAELATVIKDWVVLNHIEITNEDLLLDINKEEEEADLED